MPLYYQQKEKEIQKKKYKIKKIDKKKRKMLVLIHIITVEEQI